MSFMKFCYTEIFQIYGKLKLFKFQWYFIVSYHVMKHRNGTFNVHMLFGSESDNSIAIVVKYSFILDSVRKRIQSQPTCHCLDNTSFLSIKYVASYPELNTYLAI